MIDSYAALLAIGITATFCIQIWVLTRLRRIAIEPLAAKLNSIESSLTNLINQETKKSREESSNLLRMNREELTGSLRQLNDSLVRQFIEFSTSGENRFDKFQGQIEFRIKTLEASSTQKIELLTQRNAEESKNLREEISVIVQGLSANLTTVMTTIGDHQKNQLDSIKSESLTSNNEMRTETRTSVRELNETIVKALSAIGDAHQNQSRSIAESQNNLISSNQKKLDEIKVTVEGKLKLLQEDNNKQLDQMRVTVDEKLHGTLEKRLGESFKQVSDRLEAVHKGLGEMQVLANGVGDLKKVLTNVKTRGTWGEVQLGAMLDQVLTAEQFASNVSPKENGERVEFAIKMPGRGADKESLIWLPIDSKFPLESYQRLCEAQEQADHDGIEMAVKMLEINIKKCAQDISSKYIFPPKTTDFAILFLPTEGLFAEVIRRVSLIDQIQRDYRVVVAGPTTLWSILNSLQMGFQTLAIEKRSSDVWKLLSAVKTEWNNYGEALDKVKKNLQAASNNIDKVAVRTRAVGRKLRDVRELSMESSRFILSGGESEFTDLDVEGEQEAGDENALATLSNAKLKG